jgi:hypothetical protein
MPISRETFEQNFQLLGRVFNNLYASGLGIAGPRLAALTLKKTAEDMTAAGDCNVAVDLLNEMHRLCNVLVPKVSKFEFEMIPWSEALDKKLFSEDDAAEVENALTFFMVASCMHKRKEMPGVFDVLSGNWGAYTSSLPPTEYVSSLKTSTEAETTGESGPEPAKPSSIPY